MSELCSLKPDLARAPLYGLDVARVIRYFNGVLLRRGGRAWLNAHDSKSCVPQGTGGSNPSPSATSVFIMQSLLQAIAEGRLIALSDTHKDGALEDLSHLIAQAGNTLDAKVIFQRMMDREAVGNTYLGHGIACPHARITEPGDLICAIGWSRGGVDYGNEDGTPARILLAYYVPDNVSHAFLHEISSLARIFESNSPLRETDDFTDLRDVHVRLIEWADAVANDVTSSHALPLFRASATHLRQVLLPEIIDMMVSGRLSEVRRFLIEQPAPEIAELMDGLQGNNRILLFRLLPRHLADEVFSLLELPAQNTLIAHMAKEETRQVISALPPDDRTALFEELPARVLQELLNLLSDEDRRETLAMLSYPEDSVGRLMTNRYVSIRADWSVATAIDHIRKTGTDSETMVMVYVTDAHGVLIDDLLLRKVILAEPTTSIRSLMDGHYAALTSLQDREEAVRVFKKYNLYALPVIDDDGVLLGIVTTDDILDVAEEEATEDIHKGSAIRPLEEEYLRAPLRMLYRGRVHWLLVLVLINILSGAGIAHFSGLISRVVTLVVFLPLVIASGGNAGSQAATLVIRSMALGELEVRDYFKAVKREMRVSLGLGLSMAAAVFLLAWWRADVALGMVVSLAMVSIVFVSSLLGLSLPFVLRKLGQDPAVASGPLVASIADILGVLLYFGIASAWLS